MEFIRFGNLTPQKHYQPETWYERTFHTAPIEKGFYAFPKGWIETFLLGGVGSGSLQNGRYKKFKDKNGKPYKIKGSDFEEFKNQFSKKIQKRLRLSFSYDDWYDKYADDESKTYDDCLKELNDNIWDVWIENEPTRFNYNGLIWHHMFNINNPQLDKEYPNFIKVVDQWVLTDIKTYEICLNRYIARNKLKASFAEYIGYNKSRKKPPGFNYGGINYPYSKDEFEVFIENIQNDGKN